MCETHVRASHHTREGKRTRTIFDKKTVRARDRQLREQREAVISEGRQDATEHRLPLQSRYEQMIRQGHKTIEGRVFKGVAAKIKPGDIVVFGSAKCIVREIYTYGSFEEMLIDCGLDHVLPRCPSIQQGVQVYYGFPGYRQAEAQHGVVAFCIELCNANKPHVRGVSASSTAACPPARKDDESNEESSDDDDSSSYLGWNLEGDGSCIILFGSKC